MDYHATTGLAGNQNLLDILKICTVLRARTKRIALTAAIFVILSVIVTTLMTPVYEATSAVLIDPTVQQPFDTRIQTRASPQENTQFIDSQVTLITSDSVLRPVVLAHDLVNDREFGADASGGMRWLLQMLRPRAAQHPNSEQSATDKALIALAEATTVKRDGQTFVLNIAVESRDPVKAATLSRAIATSYLNDQRKQRESASKQVAAEIEDRLVGLRERLRLADDKVREFRAQNNLQEVGEAGLLTEQELSGVNTSLIEARAELAAAEAKNSEIQRLLLPGANTDKIVTTIDSPTILHLYQQFTEASRRVADLRVDLLPSHPTLVRAEAQLDQVRRMIRDEVKRIAESTQLELEVARGRVANLERQLSSTRTLNNADDAARIRLKELQTEAQATRALYENALSRAKEIVELEQVVLPTARIISPATVPENPAWPKKKLIVALAGVLGLLVGACLAIGSTAFELLKARLFAEDATSIDRSAHPVTVKEHTSGVAPAARATSGYGERYRSSDFEEPHDQEPVLGYLLQFPEIAAANADPAGLRNAACSIRRALQSFYANESSDPSVAACQAVEDVHRNLDDMSRSTHLRSVLITSPLASREQTIVALTLALAGSCRGMRVLLIDAETASRDLTRTLDPRRFLRQLSLVQRLREDPELGISFLSLSVNRGVNGQLQLSDQACEEMATLILDHDLTIINGPGLNDLHSAAALIEFVDQVVLASSEGSVVSLLTTPARAA